MKKICTLILILLVINSNAQNTVNNSLEKLFQSTVFLFEKDKDILGNNIAIGTGVIVDNGNILIPYNLIEPYESIIPNSNDKYSTLKYTDINQISIRCYTQNKYDSTTINKIIAFDKNTNMVLLEPKQKIGKSIKISNNSKVNNTFYHYIIPLKQYSNKIDWTGITKIGLTSTISENTISVSVSNDDDTTTTLSDIKSNNNILTYCYNANFELVTLNNNFGNLNLLEHNDFMDLSNQFNKEYNALLAKKNGHQFSQFYIEEQYNAIMNKRQEEMLYIQDHASRLLSELKNIKTIDYFNSVTKYDQIKSDLNFWVNLFGSPKLNEMFADNLYSYSGINIDALKCLYRSVYKDSSNIKPFIDANKLQKLAKWFYEIGDIYQSLKILNEIPNYTTDWKILSEVYLRISYAELQRGNLKEAEQFKNKALQHGLTNYNDGNLKAMYDYIIEKTEK